MKKLTAHQEKVLAEIRKSVSYYQRFRTADEYVACEIEETNFWGSFSEAERIKLIEDWTNRYSDEFVERKETNSCFIYESVTPATLKALEDAGYIRKLRESEKGRMDIVQLLK